MNIQDDMEWITCDSPVNIAVIKYWGKRDEKLILPLNSSVSITLNHEELRARTTVAISRNFNEDKMWLNGNEGREMIKDDVRSVAQQKQADFKHMRYEKKKAPILFPHWINDAPKTEDSGCMVTMLILGAIHEKCQITVCHITKLSRKRKTDCDQLDEKLQWKLHICSENNFPTAAGLASSAAGYACLVYALSKLYGINGDISKIARLGSGSACRSLYGGFVIWNKGESSDGEDSKAEQIAPETHWPELRILILVVSDQTKHTGSTVGMQTTVATSELLQQRLQTVPQKVDKIKQAILNKDFHSFAEITMKDSNQLHAVCLDTYPPVSYLNDTSHHIMQLVHAINEDNTSNMVAYSFDAGPNAFLFMQEKDVPTIINILRYFYPSSDPHFLRGLPVPEKDDYHVDYTTFIELKVVPRALKFVIYTKPGPEPSVKETDCGLLASDGLPKLHQ